MQTGCYFRPCSTAGAPGTYTVRLAFKDAQRAVGLGSVTLFGVKVRMQFIMAVRARRNAMVSNRRVA